MAEWSTAYVNGLPDKSFAYIAPGGEKDDEGKTTPRSLRYLPYKDADGKPDEAHVRNALARLPQTDIPDSAKASAKRKLEAAAKELGIEVGDDSGKAAEADRRTKESRGKTFRAGFEVEVKAVDGPDYPYGGFEATISAPRLDRDNEIIDAGAFNPLPGSIPIFGDHVATIATTVARAVPTYQMDGTLKAVGRFDQDEYSQMVRNKVRNGFVTTMSVGYMNPVFECDPSGIWHTKSAELLEASFVPIPSLREATVSMAKALKAGRRNSTSDASNLQAAHDALHDAHESLMAAGGADISCNDPDMDGDVDADVEPPDAAPKATYAQHQKMLDDLLEVALHGKTDQLRDLALDALLQTARATNKPS